MTDTLVTTEATTVHIPTTTQTVTTDPIVTNQIRSGNEIGTFTITVYTPYSDNGRWGYATATVGKQSRHLATCAVDPSVIPLGAIIEVNGLTLECIDTGSSVKGNKIDIFYDGTPEEAVNWIRSFGTEHTVKHITEVF